MVGSVGYGNLLHPATSPDLVLAPTGEGPIIRCCQALQLLVGHGSGVLEHGQAGDRFVMVAVSVGTCQPGCLYGDGVIVAHGLGGGLSLATCPYDLAGLEAGGGGHDHGSGLSVGVWWGCPLSRGR